MSTCSTTRQGTDKQGRRCRVADCTVHPDTVRLAQSNKRMMQLLIDIALEQAGSAMKCKLSREYKLPNMKFKSTPDCPDKPFVSVRPITRICVHTGTSVRRAQEGGQQQHGKHVQNLHLPHPTRPPLLSSMLTTYVHSIWLSDQHRQVPCCHRNAKTLTMSTPAGSQQRGWHTKRRAAAATDACCRAPQLAQCSQPQS